MKMAIKINGQWHEVWGLLSHTIDHIVFPQFPADIHLGDVLPANTETISDATPLRDGYTKAQLQTAFDKVKNKRNWKNPISRVIRADEDQRVIAAAISFYCGSPCEFQRTGNGQVKVTAPGYYACIGS